MCTLLRIALAIMVQECLFQVSKYLQSHQKHIYT